MGSRMDKYKENNSIPTRSDKNKELYKQIYNAYDEFENLIVPSNSREIDINDLKMEITSRQDYRKQRDYKDLIDKEDDEIKKNARIELKEEKVKDNEVYDINELLNKAVGESKKAELIEPSTLSNDDYLKKLKLDNRRTNIEQVKELYDDISDDESMEDESLMKTANLSLEILSDLKGDSDKTVVSAPIKDEELPESNDDDFYSTGYKFSKKDFIDKDFQNNEEDEDEDDEDETDHNSGNGKFFFKVLLLIFVIILIVLILLYFINYLIGYKRYQYN